jgi:hypothetical protein
MPVHEVVKRILGNETILGTALLLVKPNPLYGYNYY